MSSGKAPLDAKKGNRSSRGASASLRESVPFPNSYWVIPGKLLAGHYLGSEDPATADKRLKALLDHGLRTFIDLMEPGEVNWTRRPFAPYAPRLKALADAQALLWAATW